MDKGVQRMGCRILQEVDHRIMADGYISITAHKVDCTDYQELERLKGINIESSFK